MEMRFSYYDYAKKQIPWYYEDNSAFRNFASEVAKEGEKRSLSENDFAGAVHEIFEAYSTFLSALNPSAEDGKGAKHWNNKFRSLTLGKKLGEPYICAELLDDAVYRYLKGPLRIDRFDRALLDALIAQESFAFVDRCAGRGALLTNFGFIAFLVIGGLLINFLFGSADFNATLKALAIGGAIIVVFWAFPWRGYYPLYRTMKDTYFLLSGSVVSVRELRKAVDHAKSRGVVWPPELYAVLDDIEPRTAVL